MDIRSLKKELFVLLILLGALINPAFAQFAPPAGQEGSTAIHMDSSVFVDWANSILLERGWLNIMDTDLGYVSAGINDNGIGKADFSVVSLGDLGKATLTFDKPIVDGPGFDFAVFENAFDDNFLELAFVEVSSDGENFFVFPAISLTQTDVQVEPFGTLDATEINNMAGKYRSGYGVPFDLAELAEMDGLDVANIIQVRITDAIGSLSAQFGSFDSQGNIVNDPFPTPFESGGFDLDAIGVIHNTESSGVWSVYENLDIDIYPNPCQTNIWLKTTVSDAEITIRNSSGKVMFNKIVSDEKIFIETADWPAGLYVIKVVSDDGIGIKKIIKQ